MRCLCLCLCCGLYHSESWTCVFPTDQEILNKCLHSHTCPWSWVQQDKEMKEDLLLLIDFHRAEGGSQL